MKKILFTEPNRIATVDGRKINTRRILNPQPQGSIMYVGNDILEDGHYDIFKPRYKVGETVYIAEPYKIITPGRSELVIIEYGDLKRRFSMRKIAEEGDWIEKRNKEMFKSKSGFCNKMFMPEWAARTFIKITDARCERLQDISDEDCFREGIFKYITNRKVYCRYPGGDTNFYTPREAYAAEIDMINGKGTWDSNPYMWSYYYGLVNK